MSSANQIGLNLRQLINVFRRRRRMLVGTALASAAALVAISLAIGPRYTAKAQMVVDPERAGGDGPAVMTAMLDTAAIESHVAILGSDSHLITLLDSLRSDGSIDTASGERGAKLDFSRLDLERLRQGFNVFKERQSRVIGVTFTTDDKVVAAAVVNRAVRLYLSAQVSRNLANRGETLKGLHDRIPTVKAELDRAEAALNAYRLVHHANGSAQAGDQQQGDFTGSTPEIRLQELQREAAAFRRLYDDLLRRQKTMLEESELRVLSFASVPDRPSSPSVFLFALPGLMLGAMGAGLVAVLLEQLDDRLRTEQDIHEGLNVRCIGVIPHRGQQAYRLDGGAAYREAMRSTVISAFEVAAPATSPRLFMVTSSVPREGKSTFATDFAATAAELERRVLLVDLDFAGFGGLSQYLAERSGRSIAITACGCDPENAIRAIPELGFDYLPLAAVLGNPVAVLASDKVRKLLRELSKRYDGVVVDAGQLLGASESRVLAAAADKVLFIVKWQATKRPVAQNALQLLQLQSELQPTASEHVYAVIVQTDLARHSDYEQGAFGDSLRYVRPPARACASKPSDREGEKQSGESSA